MYHGQTGYCAGPEVGLWEVGRSIWNLFLAVLTRPIIDKFLAHLCRIECCSLMSKDHGVPRIARRQGIALLITHFMNYVRT